MVYILMQLISTDQIRYSIYMGATSILKKTYTSLVPSTHSLWFYLPKFTLPMPCTCCIISANKHSINICHYLGNCLIQVTNCLAFPIIPTVRFLPYNMSGKNCREKYGKCCRYSVFMGLDVDQYMFSCIQNIGIN